MSDNVIMCSCGSCGRAISCFLCIYSHHAEQEAWHMCEWLIGCKRANEVTHLQGCRFAECMDDARRLFVERQHVTDRLSGLYSQHPHLQHTRLSVYLHLYVLVETNLFHIVLQEVFPPSALFVVTFVERLCCDTTITIWTHPLLSCCSFYLKTTRCSSSSQEINVVVVKQQELVLTRTKKRT